MFHDIKTFMIKVKTDGLTILISDMSNNQKYWITKIIPRNEYEQIDLIESICKLKVKI